MCLKTVKKMEFVVQAIIERGELTGVEDKNDDYDRYGLYFDEPGIK